MTKILSTTGGPTQKEAKLPKVFSTEYRPDLIRKAYDAIASHYRQPQGVDPAAGLKTSADYFGSRRNTYRQTINKGMTRLPREKPGGGGLGKVRRIPQSVGGRAAHPPKPEKKLAKKINNKEYIQAIRSAIAATASRELVLSRNHKLDGVKEFPLIIEDKIQKTEKAKDLKKILESLGLAEELKTSKNHKILLAVGEDEGIRKAASNIPGIQISLVNELDLDILAPGAKAGVLTIWTESALEKIDGVMGA
ncbi:MAG TPA: 50S ribosomal protein L4 [Candidatus Altiarchaeales archaeon]|nr:50S ribosomal protein L4 [Candidatus Altiarchaeales archaeon]